MQTSEILSQSKEIREWIVEKRRTIHRHPELMYEEFETSKLVQNTLKDLEIPYEKDIAITGVVGIIGNGFVGSAILHGFILHVDNIMIYDRDPQRSTHSMKDLATSSDVIFICVPTPMFESGECDLSIVESVTEELSQYAGIEDKVVVIKSTVVPGTTETLAQKYPNMSRN